MIAYKKTVFFCVLICVPLFLAVFFIMRDCKLYDLSLGMLSSLLCTLMLTFVLYFHERETLLRTIYVQLSSFHFGLINITKLTGDFLEDFLVERNFTAQNFYKITSLIRFTESKFLPKKEVQLFNCFISTLLNNTISDFSEYMRKIHNLQSIAISINTDIVKYQNTLDQQKNEDNQKLQSMMRDAILVRVAKLHEYQASLSIELDNLLAKFSEQYKFQIDWTKTKQLNEEACKDYWRL